MIQRGDVYYVTSSNKEPVGHQIWQGRPAVVVSNNSLNDNETTIEVVFLTSKPKRDIDEHVTFYCKDRNATALCEQVTTLDISQFSNYMCTLDEDTMSQIENAMAMSLGISGDYTVYGTPATTEDVEFWKSEAEKWKTLYNACHDALMGSVNA